MRTAAILWDYDGTLVDSAVKNRYVTVQLLKRFDPDIERHLPPALQSVEAYRQANLRWSGWKEVFRREYGLTLPQLEEAGRLWSGYQKADPLQPPLFCGLRDVLPQLSALAPMGICSRNSSENIRTTLRRYGVEACFGAVIGYDELPPEQQKPDPAGYLECLRRLGVQGGEGLLYYIGDNRSDVQFARAAAEQLQAQGVSVQMCCVTARFGDRLCVTRETGADACAAQPEELLSLPGLSST